MARWYCIPPANYLEMMKDWDTHMIIAPHALGRNRAERDYYLFYFMNPDLYTIIDNGLWEGHVVKNEKLLDMANKLHVNEIIAPDSPYGKVTTRKTKQFINLLKQKGQRDDFVVHGVVHGGNLKDREKCLDKLIALDVDVIDIPKMFGPEDRKIFMERNAQIFLENNKPVHFLGFYKEELPLLQGKPSTIPNWTVRSFDTSVPFKPKYENGFQLDLPYSWWNRFIIKARVRSYKRLYNYKSG